jgi:hypothetical protein
VDPTLVLAILMCEVNDSEKFDFVDQLVQVTQFRLNQVGLYRWVKMHFTSKGNSPPSLGWGNVQEGVFDDVKSNPDAFDGISWTDMIRDHDLAIKVVAYRVKDLDRL